ncbi:transposase [Martelella lutilitoris]|uniref:Transposase n=1 Tax=Martelella lutilitoris TaxID=2583532 RepID=A0A5C4JPM2_9HYPH|nr:transposase [Martelella lutilitoris]TNB47074.1 transposase [Martelella lutilitoris]
MLDFPALITMAGWRRHRDYATRSGRCIRSLNEGDAPHFRILLDLGPDVTPRAVVADKGYASKANRNAARSRGAIPVIPHKANEKDKPARFANAIYRGRTRIEQAVGKLKRFKRVALRCEKTKRNFSAIVSIAAAFNLMRSVHKA